MRLDHDKRKKIKHAFCGLIFNDKIKNFYNQFLEKPIV